MKDLTPKSQLIILASATLAAGLAIYILTAFEGEFRVMKIEEKQKIDKYINESINNCIAKYKRGEYHEALESALKLNTDNLDTEQQRARLILLGDINKHFYDTYKGNNEVIKRSYLDKAQRYYKRARLEHFSPSIHSRKEIARRIANLYISDGDWENAYKTFKENESLDISAEERWRTKLLQAEALLKLKKPQYFKAIKILSQIANDDDCDDVDIWGEAMRKKSVLLYEATQNPAIMTDILTSGHKSTVAPTKADLKEYSKEFLKEAEDGFHMILNDEKLFNSPQRTYAELGIMKILVARNDREKAYSWANEVHFSSGTDTEKAEALYLLSVLEEKNGNIDEAINILTKSIDRYEKPAFTGANAPKLFELYMKDKQYDNAFLILSRLMTEYATKKRIEQLSREFLPDGDKLITKISELSIPQNAKYAYYEQGKKLLKKSKVRYPQYWNHLNQLWSYLEARLTYLQNKIPETEKLIEKILDKEIGDEKLKEMVYRLDLQCAQKKGIPEIEVCRAERYMKFFPEGKYYISAINTLEDSYYKIGLFEAALEISKKMYVAGLNRMRQGIQTPEQKKQWLNTVAKIGCCYYKLGLYDKSEQLIKAYCDELLKQPDVGEIYQDWSEVAIAMGQQREAIRRLDVAIPRTKEVNLRTEMRVARNLLKLKRNKEIDYLRAVSLLDRIRETHALKPEIKEELQKKLGNALLEYNYTKQPKKFRPFLDKMISEYKGAPWLNYWLLKSLSPLFGTTELTTLAKEYQKILDENFSDKGKETQTTIFLKNQLNLINSLTPLDKSYDKLKIRQNGALYNEQNN